MPTTVILGAGIIGLSTAYYLSQFTSENSDHTNGEEKHEIHLVEQSPELFASASGKAAGFLAKDWFAPAVASLGEFSFDLHRKLAEEHGGREKWGWSESTSYSLDRYDSVSEDEEEDIEEVTPAIPPSTVTNGHTLTSSSDSNANGHSTNGSRTHKNDLGWLMDGSSRMTLLDDPSAGNVAEQEHESGEEDVPPWLRARRSALQLISDRATTGQVDPYRLCQFLLQECLSRGVKLHQPARATRLLHSENDLLSPTAVRIEFSDSQTSTEARGSPNSLSPPPANGNVVYTSEGGESIQTNGSGHLKLESPPRTIDISCDSIVITAGCWTPRVYRTLFPNAGRIPRVTALAGHSVVLRSKHWPPSRPNKLHSAPDMAKVTVDHANDSSSLVSPASSASGATTASLALIPPTLQPACHAVFTNDPAGYSPEIFSRLGGDVWLGGLNSSTIPLPTLATQTEQSPEAIETLVKTAKALCGDDIETVRSGLCFRPVAPTGRPVIARMHEADLGDGVQVPGGVYVATGHGPWGISLSLGTGHIVSEMVLGRQPSVDVRVLRNWEAQSA